MSDAWIAGFFGLVGTLVGGTITFATTFLGEHLTRKRVLQEAAIDRTESVLVELQQAAANAATSNAIAHNDDPTLDDLREALRNAITVTRLGAELTAVRSRLNSAALRDAVRQATEALQDLSLTDDPVLAREQMQSSAEVVNETLAVLGESVRDRDY